ncbi:MAG: Transcriptional regulator, TetR family [Acidobacteriaceae bacterium]|nr:Transcriptional regulator, TetR family [Acidobacteriaceae bacterium]
MRKPTHKTKILQEGLRVVHERGYSASSVRDIIQAAGVPQGSFTNHFATKEAFGLEILELFYEPIQKLMAETLLNDALPPLKRLRMWAETGVNSLNQNNQWNGCLLGNFGAEANAEIDTIQARLAEIFSEQQRNIAYCLRAAVKARELPAKTKCGDLAVFIHASFEGSLLLAKAQRSLVPTERFKKVLFSTLLSPSA